jgi:glucose/arabinose dehydrogenase
MAYSLHSRLTAGGFLLASSFAPVVRADLAAAFATKISVDTQYVSGAGGATDIAFAADGRALVTRKGGSITLRRSNGSQVVIGYPFGGTLDTGSEKGLLGVVADPNVAQSGAFYFYVSNGPTNDKHRVYRAVLTAADTLTVDSAPVIAAARGVGPGLEGPANHDGGGMFIHNGQLYIGVGDTGANASPPVNKYGSCLNKGNGKILRVNLDGSVPGDNPLVGLAAVTACDTPTGPWSSAAPDSRIFAWGLRNPWRLWVDAATGLLWIGDVGEASQEEIDIGAGDNHYGYPFVEGNRVWGDVDGRNCASLTPSRACRAPAYAYTRDQGQAVTGGLIPQGCGWTNVFGGAYYVYGDSSQDWIRALPVSADRRGFASTAPVDVASYAGSSPVSFRMGPDRALYVVMNGAGAVYRFAPIQAVGGDCPTAVPASLGRYRLSLLVGVLMFSGLLSLARRRDRGRCRSAHARTPHPTPLAKRGR